MKKLHEKTVSELGVDDWLFRKAMKEERLVIPVDKEGEFRPLTEPFIFTEDIRKWSIAIVKECKNCVPQTGIEHECRNEKRLNKKCIACKRDIDRFELTEKDLQ